MVKKLNQEELDSFRDILLKIRAEITGDINKLEEDAFGINGEKAAVDVQADDGADSYSMEFNLELLELDENSLRNVDEALKRLDEGTFGRCEECKSLIRKTRLKAMPYARRCIDCQRELEQAG